MPFVSGSSGVYTEDTVNPDIWEFQGFIDKRQEERIRYHLNKIVDIINKEKPSKKARKRFRVL